MDPKKPTKHDLRIQFISRYFGETSDSVLKTSETVVKVIQTK
jgi:hypothetical protein